MKRLAHPLRLSSPFSALLFAAFLSVGAGAATSLPYDEAANAQADLQAALAQAQKSGKKVLAVFGANWCPDCRELDKAMHGRSAEQINASFVVVKIDVGNFNKNTDLAAAYGNPIKKGIPAAVVLTPDNKMLYSTKGGELSSARHMGDQGIADFFAKVIAEAK
jgi:thioredoxin 1